MDAKWFSKSVCFKSLAKLPTKRRKSFSGHWDSVGSDHVVPAADRACALPFVDMVGNVGGGGGCVVFDCWEPLFGGNNGGGRTGFIIVIVDVVVDA